MSKEIKLISILACLQASATAAKTFTADQLGGSSFGPYASLNSAIILAPDQMYTIQSGSSAVPDGYCFNGGLNKQNLLDDT